MSILDKDLDRETARDLADYERKRRRETSSCGACGSPDPVRIEAGRCSDCYDGWPKCSMCGRWTDLKGSLAVETQSTPDGDVCAPCARRWLLNLPA